MNPINIIACTGTLFLVGCAGPAGWSNADGGSIPISARSEGPALKGVSHDVRAVWHGSRGLDSARWPAVQPLVKEDLSNVEFKPGTWTWRDGVLVGKGGHLWSKENYGNFVLSLDFRCEQGANSGILLRCSDTAAWRETAIEVQILQGETPNDKDMNGAIVNCVAPVRQIRITPGEWYNYVIVAKGANLTVYLNHEEITKMNLNQWTHAGKNPDGTPNKFKTAYKDMARVGRIGLQYHGSSVAFRNLWIEPL
ncbi:MAG: DUF1080 domain-containing protein [Opitutaceae bacterium]|nr:DUF1080 domain-containing protein [Opitutaceae bacterium]